MDLLPDSEQSAIADTFRRFLETELPLQRLQSARGDENGDHSHWPDMASLGWFGIAQKEHLGGSGLSSIEETLLCIEAGKQLVSPTLIAMLLGGRLAAHAGHTDLASEIIAGRHRIALALPLATGASDPDTPTASAALVLGRSGGGEPCDYLLLASPSTATLLTLDARAVSQVHSCVDEHLSLERVALDQLHPAVSLACSDCDVYRHGQVFSAAMAVGAAFRAMELSVAHAREREQFGRAIGSFQSIKHYCADMALRCEAALSLLTQASLELADQSAAADFDVPASKLLATDAAIRNAEAAIQIHGAMGFTQEMPIHSFLKRSYILSDLFGDNRELATVTGGRDMPA